MGASRGARQVLIARGNQGAQACLYPHYEEYTKMVIIWLLLRVTNNQCW